jgi:hypothetical protein
VPGIRPYVQSDLRQRRLHFQHSLQTRKGQACISVTCAEEAPLFSNIYIHTYIHTYIYIYISGQRTKPSARAVYPPLQRSSYPLEDEAGEDDITLDSRGGASRRIDGGRGHPHEGAAGDAQRQACQCLNRAESWGGASRLAICAK